jgi:tetratricopeptide (TPR) repeat protein
MKTLLTTLLCAGLSSAFAQNTDSSGYFFKKGMEEKDARRWLLASQNFDKAIKFNPKNTEAFLQNAYTQLEMRKTNEAKVNFTKVYELDPSNKTAIKELMELFYSYHQYANAIELAVKCPDCVNSQRILGMSYYQTEDYSKAEKYLAAALEKNPADAEATYTMGRNYLDMEEYNKAIPYYEKAVKLDDTRNSWMYEQGLLYYNLSDYKNALASFKNAAKHGYAQTNDFKENFGYASIYSGEYETGEALLMDIWQRKPANKDILRDMAEILYQQKQYDRSLSYCQKLMEIEPKDGKALYQAGMCFQKKGEKDRGQQMCDKAIEMDPSLESMRRKKEGLAGL